MDTFIWILQGIIGFIFLLSGLNKVFYNEKTLVEKGQTEVEGLSKWSIKFIGFAEILGAIGLFLPYLVDVTKFIVPLSTLCLGCIMAPAAYIHFHRGEYKNVLINLAIFIACVFIAYFRFREH
jgi:uncharacterized membrane protein YphA (DoxX/SURF4 family)